MRIALHTWGTSGDVRPFLALAGGLVAAGHEVTLAYSDLENADYAAWGRRGGFQVEQVGRLTLEEDELRALHERIVNQSHPLRQMETVARAYLDPLENDMFAAAQRLCGSHDLVIGHIIVHPLKAVAMSRRVPYIGVVLQTNSAVSRYLPPAATPNLGPWINPLAWKMARFFINRLFRARFNRTRRKAGLEPIKQVLDVQAPENPWLHAYSPTLQPPPPDWSPLHRVCGFLDLPQSQETWTAPSDLERFLQSGPPPVFLGFGSMDRLHSSTDRVEETTRLMVDAVCRAGCRAIVQSRWSMVTDIVDVPEVFRVDQVPHSEVFPRCAAVVHHGGAGTTHAATLAGCPSIVVAHALDQIVWGITLKDLGVAPRVLSRKTLTPAKLASAIVTVLGSPDMARRARALGAKMKQEDGVARAVEAVEEWVGGPLSMGARL
jgi:sterol 3beta-glucosyltransferase